MRKWGITDTLSGGLRPGSQRPIEMSWKNTNICPEMSS